LKNKSPHFILYSSDPNYYYLKTFGCLAFASTNLRQNKLSPRALKGVFVGYCVNTKGYMIYLLQEEKIIVTRNVKFYEDEFPFRELKGEIEPFNSSIENNEFTTIYDHHYNDKKSTETQESAVSTISGKERSESTIFENKELETTLNQNNNENTDEIPTLDSIEHNLNIESRETQHDQIDQNCETILRTLMGSRPSLIPMDRTLDLHDNKSELLKDKIVYRKLVGKLLYLAITRVDITFSVNTLSQHMRNPREVHLQAAFKVLMHLEKAYYLDHKLTYK